MSLEARDSIRSVSYLCELFPEKSGKEILEQYNQDVKANELYIIQRDQKLYDYAEMVKAKGAIYYKGGFGDGQKYYYKFTDVTVDCGKLYASVEEIVCFFGSNRGVLKAGEISIEKNNKGRFICLENYGISVLEEITEDKWNELTEYLFNVKSFWETLG